jgi:glycosyltransferase involved in cell wall biosynthesis
MRIAMVSEHASPLAVLGGDDAGGQNVHVAALSEALVERGHEVTVLTRWDDPGLAQRQRLPGGTEVVHVPAGPRRVVPKDDLLPYVPQMADWLAEEWSRRPPDVVHAHFWMSGLATLLACQELARRGRPVPATAVTFHALGRVKRRYLGDLDPSPPERVAVERRVARAADAVVATCRDEVAELLDDGADPDRLHVVPCGVDLERFGAEGPAGGPWRPGAVRLLSVGRLVERKGVDTLVAALALLPDAELVVAGGPPASELAGDAHVRRLREAGERAGVLPRLHLVGRVPHLEAARLMRAADLVLTVPWYEPFGIVPLEAMACGTPVVASAVGGMLDTVDDGVTGVLVPPRDPEAVAAAVRRLAGDRPGLARMGAAAARSVAERYSWQAVAEATERVYRGVDPSVPLPEPLVPARTGRKDR